LQKESYDLLLFLLEHLKRYGGVYGTEAGVPWL
jgi:hypothetical protein